MTTTAERFAHYDQQRRGNWLTGRQVRRLIRKGFRHDDVCRAARGGEVCYLPAGHAGGDEPTAHESLTQLW